MSELKRIQKLVKECLLADAEVLEPDHTTVVYKQILAAFKAHIEGCKRPENRHEHDTWNQDAGMFTRYELFEDGVDEDRKALMESLEKG